MKSVKSKILLVVFVFAVVLLGYDIIAYNNEYMKILDMYNIVSPQLPASSVPARLDTFSLMNNFICSGATRIMTFVFPAIILLLSSIGRVDTKKKYFKSLSSVLIIPVFYIMLFIASMIASHFNFNPTSTIYIYSPVPGTTISSQLLSTLEIIINLMLISISVINVGLIVKKYIPNYYISNIVSFVFIVIYEAVADLVIGPLLTNLFHTNFFINGLTLFDFWYYRVGVTFINMFIYSIISLLVTSLVYKKVVK